MDIDNPFETFKRSAFRLEGLPEYVVDEERSTFAEFKATGAIPVDVNPEWSHIVQNVLSAGKTIRRLRLISDEATPYEQFELRSYPGPRYGEQIRVNKRSAYIDRYAYDFWFFDEEYIARMNYAADGTFVDFTVSIAAEREMDEYGYWLKVFEASTPLEA